MDYSLEIKKLLLDWLSSKSFMGSFNLSSKDSYWEFYDMSLIDKIDCHARSKKDTNPFKRQESLRAYTDLDIYSSKDNWKKKGFVFEDHTQITHSKEIFYYLYNHLDEPGKNELLTLGERLFAFHRMFQIFKNDKEVFYRYMKINPKSFAGLLETKQVNELFNLLREHYREDVATYTDLLYAFLSSRKRQVARVEIQSLASHAVRTYAQDKEKFNDFFTDIVGDNYLLPSSEVVSIKISKNIFYNLMNAGSSPFSKNTITNYLLSLVYYLSKKERKRLFLNHAYLLNHDNATKHYIVVFDCTQTSSINYEELLTTILEMSKEKIDRDGQKEYFKKALDYYFLEKSIPSKTQALKDKINKI